MIETFRGLPKLVKLQKKNLAKERFLLQSLSQLLLYKRVTVTVATVDFGQRFYSLRAKGTFSSIKKGNKE